MSEQIRFREMKLEGGVLMIRPDREDLGKAMAFVRKMKNKVYQMEVKEYRKKRSLDANAYAWVLINKIADALRITPKEIYRQAIVNVGGNYEVIPVREEAAERFRQIWEAQGLGWPCMDMGKSKLDGYRNLRAYYGSSTYSATQMSQLIESLVQDCRALDIEVKSEEEIASLMGAWK